MTITASDLGYGYKMNVQVRYTDWPTQLAEEYSADHVKLSPKEPEKIEYIIANCAECEPYLTADYRRMLENPEELIGGMKIILQIFDKAKGVFGIENNKPDCIEKLQELVKDEPRIEVCPLETKYPQGGERQLIYAVTGRSINSKMLPADAGCIVDNVAEGAAE